MNDYSMFYNFLIKADWYHWIQYGIKKIQNISKEDIGFFDSKDIGFIDSNNVLNALNQNLNYFLILIMEKLTSADLLILVIKLKR